MAETPSLAFKAESVECKSLLAPMRPVRAPREHATSISLALDCLFLLLLACSVAVKATPSEIRLYLHGGQNYFKAGVKVCGSGKGTKTIWNLGSSIDVTSGGTNRKIFDWGNGKLNIVRDSLSSQRLLPPRALLGAHSV